MKTKPTKIDRPGAKWLPGAMALAATTASSHAAIVQITLTGNKISSTSAGGDSLNADLTGDGINDVLFSGKFASSAVNKGGAWVKINGNRNAFVSHWFGNYYAEPAFMRNYPGAFVVSNSNNGVGRFKGALPVSGVALNTISFSDTKINGGAVTHAWLEVRAFNTSATSHTVQLTRLIVTV